MGEKKGIAGVLKYGIVERYRRDGVIGVGEMMDIWKQIVKEKDSSNLGSSGISIKQIEMGVEIWEGVGPVEQCIMEDDFGM